jgi:hypothetical protein
VKTLHTDESWTLWRGPDHPRFPYRHWLGHRCRNGATYFRYLGNIDTPCEECGSVAPKGLRGMFLAMMML